MDLASRIDAAKRTGNTSSGRARHGRGAGGRAGTMASSKRPRAGLDSDVEMGDASAPRDRYSPYTGRGKRGRGSIHKHSHEHSENIILEITGWDGASQDDFISFVFRKSNVRLNQPSFVGNQCFVSMPKHASPPVLKLDGARFAKQQLQVKESSDVPMHTPQARTSFNTTSNDTIAQLRAFLQSKYNPESKFLDLSALAQDPILMQLGIFQQQRHTQSKFFPALMKLAGQEFPDVETINLAHNNFESLVPVTTLSQSYPKLHNLSLAGNRIRRYRDLDVWGYKDKLPQLKELLLLENPVRDDAIKSGRENEYIGEIHRRFPNLQLLDGTAIQSTSISFGVEDQVQVGPKERTALPEPIKGAFFDSDSTRATAMEFCSRMFPLFDTDRQALLGLYTETATFSLSIDTSIHGHNKAGRHASAWASLSSSRNLSRVGSSDARTTRLSSGRGQISQALKAFQPTHHDLSQVDEFLVDAWTLQLSSSQTCIQIIVHGCFMDLSAKTKRSFDRTLVIVPGSQSPLILSDILVCHQYVGNQAWHEPRQDESNHDEQIDNLMRQTRLNRQFAIMCLEQNSWDLSKALDSFNQSHSANAIPPEAYIQPGS